MQFAHGIVIFCRLFAVWVSLGLVNAFAVGQISFGRGYSRVTVTRQSDPLWYWVAILLHVGVVAFLIFALPALIAATAH